MVVMGELCFVTEAAERCNKTVNVEKKRHIVLSRIQSLYSAHCSKDWYIKVGTIPFQRRYDCFVPFSL